MKDQLVTIGVTCYNNEEYVKTCIDSILNQTYKNIEIIVVDDCSTDKSVLILAQYDDRIKLIRHETNSGGLMQGRKDVIAAASGEYVHHLDADDFLQPEFASHLVEEFRNDPQLDWVASNLNVVNEHGEIVDKWDYKDFPIDPMQGLYRGFHTASVPVPKNGLFKLSFIRKNNLSWYQLPHTAQGEDAYTCIKYLECNPKIKLIPDYLVNYRVHGENMSAKVAERVKMVIDLKEYYIQHFNEMVYLFHPQFLKLEYFSDEYLALKYYLIASDFFNAKKNFRIPALFEGEKTQHEIRDSLLLFDEPVQKYAELSLHHAVTYGYELKQIIKALEARDIPAGAVTERAASLVAEGRRKLRFGDFGQAKAAFETALRESPNSVEALCGLGEVCYAQSDLDQAERYFASALKLAPDDPQTLNNAGVILHAGRNYSRAETAFRRALSADPNSADAYFNICELWGEVWPTTPPDPTRKRDLLRTLQWISEHAADGSRDKLLSENRQLRETLLRQYDGAYQSAETRILLHRPGNGALKYLMDSWCEVLNYLGIKTAVINWGEKTQAKCESFQPTVFITVADPSYIGQLDVDYLKRYHQERELQIGHISIFEHRYEPCDFLITFHLDPRRDPVMSNADLPLLSLPFAINPLQHYMRPGTEIWDYFFVGTHSPFKATETESYLLPIVRNRHGILAGTNWGRGVGELQVEEAARLYNFARVYPNYHVHRQMEEFNELNERTFIIPACGGFELVDNPVAMRELFNDDEMAVANSPREFQEMFDYFLTNPDKRLPYIRKGMRRVYREYTLFHALSRLAEFLQVSRSQSSQHSIVGQKL